MKSKSTWIACALIGVGVLGCNEKKVSHEGGPTASASASARVAAAIAGEGKAADPAASDPAGANRGPSQSHVHLPPGCLAVVNLNAKAIAADPRVKGKLIGPLDEKLAGLKKNPETVDEKRAKALFELLSINSIAQLQSVSLCISEWDQATRQPSRVTVAFGGDLGAGSDFVKKLGAFVSSIGEGEKFESSKVQGIDVLRDKKDKQMITRGGDGAVIVTNDEVQLKASVTGSKAYEKYEIPLEQHLSVIFTEQFTKAMEKASGGANPLAKMGGGRTVITVSLDGKLRASVELPSEAEAKQGAILLENLLGQFKSAPPGQAPPEIQALARSARLKVEGNSLVLTAEAPKALLDQGIEGLAAQLQQEME